MLIYILISLAVIVAGFIIVVAMQPANFCITRSATIPAPAEALFEEVNDFHKWQAWSPWAQMDPTAKNTYEGAPSGVGAGFKWEGNNQVGQGGMTILESRPDQLIRIKLEFVKPFKATHTAEFIFKPSGDQTVVSWSMTGKNNFMSKAFVLIMNCDKMIGCQFEKGLANLKSVVASGTAARF
jgi:ribosome-associated toxin RatA of RatAB toxin-antitoxin module